MAEITMTVNVFKYEELEPRIQEKVRERWLQSQYEDPDLMDQVDEEFVTALEACGFTASSGWGKGKRRTMTWATDGHERGINFPGSVDLTTFIPIATQGTKFDPNKAEWPIEELHKHLKEQKLLLHPQTAKMLLGMAGEYALQVEVIANNPRYNGAQTIEIEAEAAGGYGDMGVRLLEDDLPKELHHKRDAVKKLAEALEEAKDWLETRLLKMADDEQVYVTSEEYMKEQFENDGALFTAGGSTRIDLPNADELEG